MAARTLGARGQRQRPIELSTGADEDDEDEDDEEWLPTGDTDELPEDSDEDADHGADDDDDEDDDCSEEEDEGEDGGSTDIEEDEEDECACPAHTRTPTQSFPHPNAPAQPVHPRCDIGRPCAYLLTGAPCLLALCRSEVDGIPDQPSQAQLMSLLVRNQSASRQEQAKTNALLVQLVRQQGAGFPSAGRGSGDHGGARAARNGGNRRPPRDAASLLDGHTRLFGPGLRGRVVQAVATAWFKKVRTPLPLLPSPALCPSRTLLRSLTHPPLLYTPTHDWLLTACVPRAHTQVGARGVTKLDWAVIRPLAMAAVDLDPQDVTVVNSFALQFKGEVGKIQSKSKQSLQDIFFDQLLVLKKLPSIKDAGAVNPPMMSIHKPAFLKLRAPPDGFESDNRYKFFSTWHAARDGDNELMAFQTEE